MNGTKEYSFNPVEFQTTHAFTRVLVLTVYTETAATQVRTCASKSSSITLFHVQVSISRSGSKEYDSNDTSLQSPYTVTMAGHNYVTTRLLCFLIWTLAI